MGEEITFTVEIHIAGEIDDNASGRDELLAESGEQVLQRYPSGFEERVGMCALRHPSAYDWLGWQLVSLDDRHVGKSISQNASRKQAGHTRSNHYCCPAFLGRWGRVVSWNGC